MPARSLTLYVLLLLFYMTEYSVIEYAFIIIQTISISIPFRNADRWKAIQRMSYK